MFVFGGLLRVGTARPPFRTSSFSRWAAPRGNLFCRSVMWATRSLEMNGGIRQAVLPRPQSAIRLDGPALVVFAVHRAVLIGALIFYRVSNGGSGISTRPLIVATGDFSAILLRHWPSACSRRPRRKARDVRFGLGYCSSSGSF